MLLFDSRGVSHLTREERSPGSVAKQKALSKTAAAMSRERKERGVRSVVFMMG